ncbi:methyltransferase [Erythrobacter sp. SG61-1L]|uniref:methyltransferase n=1 Tax=Erythrobacter sp. SG61-1L TaxID=1603897 RepID=UPI0006C923F4|nr:methyltransferase [Erythrobacter sp. SG61-1L]
MATAQDQLRELIGAYWKPHVVTAAARLGVADAMNRLGGAGAVSASALAADLGADASALARLLRAMAAIGLVSDEGENRFALTEMGQCLRSDSPLSLKGMALHVGTQLSPAFTELAQCVSTGRPPAGIAHGPDGFAEFADNPEAAAIFNQSMVDNSRRFAAEAAATYDFTRFATLADVGGGYGAVLATLLNAAPDAQGCVLDLAHAREGALALFAREGLGERARFVTASFFDPLPEAADCYVLKYILHDWNDAYAQRIVARVGEAAARNGGTVLVIDRIMPDRFEARADHAKAAQGDLTMMLWDGKERTLTEFEALLACGNLALTQAVPLSDNHFVIEAKVRA